jgi:hypothetical protein
MFRLPFPVVIYEFAAHFADDESEKLKPGRELVMIADVSELPDATLIGHEHEAAHTNFLVMGGHSADGCTSILSPAMVRLSPGAIDGGLIFQMGDAYGRLSDVPALGLHQEMWANARKSLRESLCCTTLVMSKSVEKRAEPAPEKLNKAREKKGKLPIPPTTFVKLKLGATQGPRLDLGGTHASPRMHWRAGHLRVIHRGTPRQREVPVAPTIVGIGGYGDLVKKDYLVTQVNKETRDGP